MDSIAGIAYLNKMLDAIKHVVRNK